MTLTEKIAYIKGMMEGMQFEADTNESKLLRAIVDLLDDMTMDVTDLGDEVASVSEYVEELDDDLADVEEYLYGDDEYEDEDDEDDDFIEVDCPHCGETVYFDDSVDPEHIPCPSCGESFSVVDAACGSCDSESCEGCELN